MRKALILTVLYLFGSEAVAQKSFRHAPTVALDDLQDNEMALTNGYGHIGPGFNRRQPLGQGPLINRPIPRTTFDDVEDNEMFLGNGGRIGSTIYNPGNLLGGRGRRFDDVEDNEMALNLNSQSAVRDAIRLADNGYRVKVGRWDAAEDAEMFNLNNRRAGNPPPFNPTPSPKFAFDDAQDGELFGVPLGNGGSGLYASGGSASGGGVAWSGVGQYSHNIGKNTQLIGGATVSHYPGSKVNIAPHVGVKFSFDDENDDQLFAEDDELFAEDDELFAEDDEFFGVPLGNGRSGIFASGGSARGGGIAWSGVGQYSHNIGKNTQLIGGATVSHAPGSRVNIAPHVGVRVRFDDEEQN